MKTLNEFINLHDATTFSNDQIKSYEKYVTKSYNKAVDEINDKIYKELTTHVDSKSVGLEKYGKMLEVKNNKVSRLQNLRDKIMEDVAKLHQGQSQTMRGHLTEVYIGNYVGAMQSISDSVGLGMSFYVLDRNAIFAGSLNPLSQGSLANLGVITKAGLRSQLTTGIVLGESINSIAKRVEGVLKKDMNKALTIARTETTRNTAQARQKSFEDAEAMGIKMKKVWLSANDNRTRDTHYSLHGQEVDNDKTFSNGLRFPCDIGPASEVVNCRCTMGTRLMEYEPKGKIKPHQEGDKYIWDKKAKKPVKVNTNIPAPTKPKLNVVNKQVAKIPKAPTPSAISSGKVQAPTQGFTKPFSKSGYNRVGERHPDISRHTLELNKLTSSELEAIQNYTGSYYSEINNYLRFDAYDNTAKTLINRMDSAFKYTDWSLTDDVIMYRGMGPSGMKVMGDDVYDIIKQFARANESDKQIYLSQLEKRILNGTFVDKGFISTTRDRGVGFYDQHIRMNFMLPKGYKNGMFVENVSRFKGEAEFIINRSQEFIIKAVEEDLGRILITLIPK